MFVRLPPAGSPNFAVALMGAGITTIESAKICPKQDWKITSRFDPASIATRETLISGDGMLTATVLNAAPNGISLVLMSDQPELLRTVQVRALRGTFGIDASTKPATGVRILGLDPLMGSDAFLDGLTQAGFSITRNGALAKEDEDGTSAKFALKPPATDLKLSDVAVLSFFGHMYSTILNYSDVAGYNADLAVLETRYGPAQINRKEEDGCPVSTWTDGDIQIFAENCPGGKPNIGYVNLMVLKQMDAYVERRKGPEKQN